MLKAGAAFGPALMAATATEAAAAPPPAPDAPQRQKGFGLTPADQANPLDARIVVFTVVAPDLAASTKFYRDVMGFAVGAEGVLAAPLSTAPGAGKAGRRYLIFHVPGSKRGAQIRVLEAPPGATANRPRPEARTWDPGLLVMEGGTKDPAESYARLTAAGVKSISSPRYYPYRGIGMDVDPMSYAPFGPAGEQMFITGSLSNDRPEWTEPGLHTTPGNAAIVSLDQRPVDAFYENALGIKRVNQFVSQQRNCNDLIGAPRDANFLWGNVGKGVSIEVWEFKMPEGTVYPTSLDRTGLAMMTMRVNDLEKCRAMCKAAGIKPVGEGALPMIGNGQPKGFTLRGAVGELVEVVAA
jgi:catechol 2,3-dioxygenase-like lactoylglutathione lyase family enzyme